MTQPLNYSRQFVAQFGPLVERDEIPEIHRDRAKYAIGWLREAVKFSLPPYGAIIDDKRLKALDDCDTARQPFPVIAIEYEAPEMSEPEPVRYYNMETGETFDDHSRIGLLLCPKRLCVFIEGDEYIEMLCMFYVPENSMWVPMPRVALRRDSWFKRNASGDAVFWMIKEDNSVCDGDYIGEIFVYASLLNALACSNVSLGDTPARKARRGCRGAIPFDDYKFLLVGRPGDGGRASGLGASDARRHPREHLRRGHIRICNSGKKTWVNAAVVSAGRGGVVSKDYSIRKLQTVQER